MFRPTARGLSIMAILSVIAGCSTSGFKPVTRQAVAVRSKTSAVTELTSARFPAPVVQHRSCVGESFCREDVVDVRAAADSDALADLDDQCAVKRGRVAAAPCPRAGAVASCRLNGESDTAAGVITVFAYASDAAKTVADHCESLEGRFETIAN